MSLEHKLKKLQLLEEKKKLKDGLPHLYGFPFYKWSRIFYESENKNNFLVAANQISKSSTAIRKNIDWATDQSKWKRRFPLRRPYQFWYLYPSKPVIKIEFEEKWETEFLPRGEFKSSEQYGWEMETGDKGVPNAIHFKSGVSIYFKSYAQKSADLQSGTVDMLTFDEELPEELWDELSQRRSANEGYLNGVFTATYGQEFWRRVMEIRGEGELFPDALKLQISKFDCQVYEDGSPSPWTLERIQKEIAMCKSQGEVQKRIYGKFVKDSGLKYGQFGSDKNLKKPVPVPHDWAYFCGVDPGGGGDGHPAAIAVVAANPLYSKARVIRGWKGQGELTSVSDIYAKYLKLTDGLLLTGKYYDWSNKEFFIFASRLNDSFIPAEKSHAIGEQTINNLFKNQMLDIDDIPELAPLVQELCTIDSSTPKNKARDDLTDAVRYAVTKLPWDWSSIKFEEIEKQKQDGPVKGRIITIDELRNEGRSQVLSSSKDGYDTIEEELAAWNELYEIDG